MMRGHVYRYGDRVALSVVGETRYLQPVEARKLVKALELVCRDMGTPYSLSTIGTHTFEHEEKNT